jgi:hypothetical protein
MRIPTYQVREGKMKHDGATQEKIDARTAEPKQMAEMYENPLEPSRLLMSAPLRGETESRTVMSISRPVKRQ